MFPPSFQQPSRHCLLTSQELQQAALGHELRDDVHRVPHRRHGVQSQDVLVPQLLHGPDLRLECVLVQQVVCGGAASVGVAQPTYPLQTGEPSRDAPLP